MKKIVSFYICKISSSLICMRNNDAGENTKKQLAFVDGLSLSATYFQGSAMAGTGERRDKLCCSKLTYALLYCAY